MKREGHPLLPTSHFLDWLALLFRKHWEKNCSLSWWSVNQRHFGKKDAGATSVLCVYLWFKNEFHAVLVNRGHNMGSFIGINFLRVEKKKSKCHRRSQSTSRTGKSPVLLIQGVSYTLLNSRWRQFHLMLPLSRLSFWFTVKLVRVFAYCNIQYDFFFFHY